MHLLDFVSYILGLGFSLILGIFKIILVAVISVIAYIKGYNGWIWGGLTLLLPWPIPIFMILIMSSIPKKVPKLPRAIRNHPAFEGKNPIVASIMALCAMIAKADGSVTREEIRYIKDYVEQRFGLSKEEIDDYAGAFEYGKNHPDEYLVFTNILTGYYRTNFSVIRILAYLFVGVSMQEGQSTSAKEAQARKIVMTLGISEYEYQALRMAHMGAEGFSQGYSNQGYAGGQGFGGYAPQENLVKKYTQVLGVSEDASMTEIKKAYRKLVKEYHPDKLAADNAPPEYIEFANKKIRDINEAYEYLEKVKGGK